MEFVMIVLWWGDIISVNLCYQTQTGELLTLLLHTRNMKLSSQQLWIQSRQTCYITPPPVETKLVELLLMMIQSCCLQTHEFLTLSDYSAADWAFSETVPDCVAWTILWTHCSALTPSSTPPGSNNDNWVTMVPAQTIMNDAEGIFCFQLCNQKSSRCVYWLMLQSVDMW